MGARRAEGSVAMRTKTQASKYRDGDMPMIGLGKALTPKATNPQPQTLCSKPQWMSLKGGRDWDT